MAKVYIVGAGPGDPGLITVKGADLLRRADLVVYAGSLVNPDLLKLCKKEAQLVNSHGKKLSELVDLMAQAALEGKLVVRLASGDPSLYGSLKEMKEELNKRKVEIEVIPGVSSLFAGAAALKEEFTVPEGPQSLVITRLPGRTPVRSQEALERFAATGASIAVFLSADRVDEIKQRALKAGLPGDTPVAVVYRASWPEEKIIWNDLKNLSQPEGIKGSAIVYILPGAKLEGKRSFLYGEKPEVGRKSFEDAFSILEVTKSTSVVESLISSFPKAQVLESGSLRKRVRRAWNIKNPIVFVGPVGVAVRMVSPLLKDKFSDPPVLCLDIAGSFVVVVTGGHHGGNRLARRIAKALGAVPVITTGTETLGVISLEEIVEERELEIVGGNTKRFNAMSIAREPIYTVGMGWRRDISQKDLKLALKSLKGYVDLEKVAVFATASIKKKDAVEKLLPLIPQDAALVIVPEKVLSGYSGISPSRAKDKLGLPGVAESAALAVLPQGEIVVPKKVVGNVTFAVARWCGE
ncbi:precorrin-4 C(11)-methyltransferase [Thermosulfidibacter takaii]|nr:precorrin-4 C(11)-methyltransferase [Thermosulfidibacter takaii]